MPRVQLWTVAALEHSNGEWVRGWAALEDLIGGVDYPRVIFPFSPSTELHYKRVRIGDPLCTPGHLAGNKPYVVPVGVAGTGPSICPMYVVRHGENYLNVTGHPVSQPVRMSWAHTRRAITCHDLAIHAAIAATKAGV